MPDRLRGAAGGWLNVGNLTGGAIGAWLTLVMAERYPPLVVGGALFVLMTIPSLFVLMVDEPERERRRVEGGLLDAVARPLEGRARRARAGPGCCCSCRRSAPPRC